MNNIKFKQGELITLEGVTGSSVIEAICEAKRFCIENKLTEVSLTCNGFEFSIEPTTDVLDVVKQYFSSAILYGKAAFIETALNNIVEKCNETTTGNVAHKTRSIKGIVANTMELIKVNI